jgi:hypothetical protein
VRVARRRGDRDLPLGVEDVGVRLERRDRALHIAVLRDDELGVAQRERRLQPDARVGAQVGALRAVEPGDALDDDRVVRRGDGGEGERCDEHGDAEWDAHTTVIARSRRTASSSPPLWPNVVRAMSPARSPRLRSDVIGETGEPRA